MDIISASMSDLPSNLVMEIISRLPIKSLMAIRCVSKSLLKLVCESYFKELYSTRAPTELFLSIWHEPSSSATLFIADHDHDHSSTAADDDIKFNVLFQLPTLLVKPNNEVDYGRTKTRTIWVGSCNGLVCYTGRIIQFAAICNPFTGECVTVPGLDRDDKTIEYLKTIYGFGFSPKCNRFKLLRMYPRKTTLGASSMTAEIYTFGESGGSWKGLSYCPDERVCHRYPTLYQGILHWRPTEFLAIITFDFDTEEFGAIRPPHFEDTRTRFLALGLFQDCLYLNVDHSYLTDCSEVWVMKEYGVQSSWIKAFSIPRDENNFDSAGEFYQPINYLQNKDILMLRNSCDMVCYNPDTSSIKVIGNTDYDCHAVSIRPSLVSLKVLLGDNVTVHDPKSWYWGPREKFKGAKYLPWQTKSAESLETQQKASSSTSSALTEHQRDERRQFLQHLRDERQSLQQQIVQLRAAIVERRGRDREERAHRVQLTRTNSY